MIVGRGFGRAIAMLASLALASGAAPASAQDGGYDAVLKALEDAGVYVEEQTEREASTGLRGTATRCAG